MIGKTNAGGGRNVVLPTDAFLIISAPANSVVTVTKGSISQALVGRINGHDNAIYNYYFTIPSTLFDSENPWTITANDGTNTLIRSLIVDSAGQYNVNIPLKLWIVKDGVLQSGFTYVNDGGTVSFNTSGADDYMRLNTPAATGSFATVSFSPRIDVTGYNSVVMDCQARGYYNLSRYCPVFGVLGEINSGANWSTFVAYTTMRANGGNTLNARISHILDISAVDSLQQIGFQVAGSGANNWEGDVYCYNLYLIA